MHRSSRPLSVAWWNRVLCALAGGALIGLLSAAAAQPLLMTQFRELDGVIDIIDPNATAERSFSHRTRVATIVLREFPSHQIVGRYVRFLVTRRFDDPNHAAFVRYDITIDAARTLLEQLDAIDELQAALHDYAETSPAHGASAEMWIPISASSDPERDGSSERLWIHSDSVMLPFFGLSLRLAEDERAATERRVLDELAALIREALAYLDATE